MCKITLCLYLQLLTYIRPLSRMSCHPPVSEMTYTVSSGTLNSTIPYHSCHPYPICIAVVYYRSETGFSTAILPNVDRPRRNLAAICCCTECTCWVIFTPLEHRWPQAKRQRLHFFLIPKMYYNSRYIKRISGLSVANA